MKLLSKYLHHGLTQNILALYGVHFAKYILPLITVPYLARVLGPTAWGLMAIAQAYAQYVGMLVEYGFGLAATREVARHREDRDKLADLLAGVLGAEGLLVLCGIGLTLLVQIWVPIFQNHPALLWAGMFWTLSQAVSPLWYFGGLERLRFVAVLDVSSRLLYVVGLLIFVHSPEDGWKVLALQGVASCLSTAVVLYLVYRELPFRFPTKSLVWQALRTGWTMFLFLSASNLYTTGNTFILGLFVSPQLVGYYAGGEKLSKTFLAILNPLTQALYPRLSHLAHHSRTKAAQLARVGVVVMGIGGGLIGLLVFLLAPLLVKILLGREFEPAVPVVQVLSLLLPSVALSHFLGLQWMLPLGMDRAFNSVILGAGLFNLLLALILAPRYAQMGMAWAAVVTELVVTAALYILLLCQGLDPFTYVKNAKGDAV